jgi:hypothetical protein
MIRLGDVGCKADMADVTITKAYCEEDCSDGVSV